MIIVSMPVDASVYHLRLTGETFGTRLAPDQRKCELLLFSDIL